LACIRARAALAMSGNTRRRLPGSARCGDRLAQAPGGAFRGFRQRAQRLDRDEALHPLRARGREQAADAGAHRMPEQREALPAQRIGDVERRVDRAGEGIVGARRQVRAATVAGQVRRDQVDARQVRGQRHEAGGVVEPAVQRQHLRRAGRAGAQAGDAAQRRIEHELLHRSRLLRRRRGHSAASARCTRAASMSACAGDALRQGM
jgi:hypothetical protein